jgi:hypothetical protein
MKKSKFSEEQNFDGLHVWDNRRTIPQDKRARHARLTGKARHVELGLARRACRARPARRALERLADFFSILPDKVILQEVLAKQRPKPTRKRAYDFWSIRNPHRIPNKCWLSIHGNLGNS